MFVFIYKDKWRIKKIGSCVLFCSFSFQKKFHPLCFGHCVSCWLGKVGRYCLDVWCERTRGRLGSQKVCTCEGKKRQYGDVFLWFVIFFWTLLDHFAVCVPWILVFVLLKGKISTPFLWVIVCYGAWNFERVFIMLISHGLMCWHSMCCCFGRVVGG